VKKLIFMLDNHNFFNYHLNILNIRMEPLSFLRLGSKIMKQLFFEETYPEDRRFLDVRVEAGSVHEAPWAVVKVKLRLRSRPATCI